MLLLLCSSTLACNPLELLFFLFAASWVSRPYVSPRQQSISPLLSFAPRPRSLERRRRSITYQSGSARFARRIALIPRCAATGALAVGADDARLWCVRLLALCRAGDRRLLLRRRCGVEGPTGALKVFRLLLAADISHCERSPGFYDGFGGWDGMFAG